MIVEGLARRPKAPSHEQFVSAVIRAHERVLMGLSAMVHGAAHGEAAPAGETGEDAEIIRSYIARHGSTEYRRRAPALWPAPAR